MRPRLWRNAGRRRHRRLCLGPSPARVQPGGLERHREGHLRAIRRRLRGRIRDRPDRGVARGIQRRLDPLPLRHAEGARSRRREHGRRGPRARPAGRDAGQRRRPQVRCDRRRDGPEHPRRGRDLAVAGHSPQRHRLSAGVRNRDRRLHPAAAVIQVRLAAPGRAARVTLLILGAAVLRALLLPAGDLFSTIVFAGCLLAITWMERGDPPPRPSPPRGEGESWRLSPARGEGGLLWPLLAGLLVGGVLLLPGVLSPFYGRPLPAFLGWGAVARGFAPPRKTPSPAGADPPGS